MLNASAVAGYRSLTELVAVELLSGARPNRVAPIRMVNPSNALIAAKTKKVFHMPYDVYQLISNTIIKLLNDSAAYTNVSVIEYC